MSTLAPRLRHRITFQRPVNTRNSDGVLSVEWETVPGLASVPAEVLTGPGREAVRSGQKLADVAARITCRWFPDLDAAWRVLWEGRILDIAGIETDRTDRRELRLSCKSGLNDGQ